MKIFDLLINKDEDDLITLMQGDNLPMERKAIIVLSKEQIPLVIEQLQKIVKE